MNREKALETINLLFGVRERDIHSVFNELGLDAFSDEALDLIAQEQLQEELSLKRERESAIGEMPINNEPGLG